MAYVAYLGKMVYPAGLAIPYPLPEHPPPAWETLAAVALLLAITTAVFMARRKCPYLLVGWLWYLGTLVPVIGLLRTGNQLLADRYTYLTQIGLYVAIAWGAAQLAGPCPARRWALAAVSVLVVAALMVGAWRQTRHSRDSETLWTRALDCDQRNAIAHNNLGKFLVGRGRPANVDKAIEHYRKALEINDRYAAAHNNLGSALADLGQIDAAIDEYHKALAIDGDFFAAHNNLGNALAGRHQADAAIEQFRIAVGINPGLAKVHSNLGIVLAGQGRFEEAVAEYCEAIRLNPDDPITQNYLGNALAACGRIEEALVHYRQALALASAGSDKALAEAIRARIRLYRSAVPAGQTP